MGNEAEMLAEGHLGAEGSQAGKKYKKIFEYCMDLTPFELHFGTWRHLFRNIFYVFVWRCLCRCLVDIWKSKVRKRLPKWSPKGTWGYPLGSERTMVFIVREAYEEVSGRVWEATFSRLRLRTLSGGVPGSILADFA
jgi:hypothetical protein